MTERPDWDLWFMRQAYIVAERGSCKRLQVGAVVVRDRDHKQVGTGYNGAPVGEPHCLDVGCDEIMIDGKLSCVRTLHAESNALDDITTGGRLSEPHTLYCTVTPCLRCAQRIIQRGITRVVYHQYYESQGTKHVERLFTRLVPNEHGRGERCVVDLKRLDVPEAHVKPTRPSDLEQEIRPLELQAAGEWTPGTMLQRVLVDDKLAKKYGLAPSVDGDTKAWCLSLGRMREALSSYYGRTIAEAIAKARQALDKGV